MTEDLQKRKKGPIGNLPVADNFLLGGSLFAVLMAAVGFAGFLWRQRLAGVGILMALMIGPAFLFGSLKDCWKQGWTWKRGMAVGFSLIALAFVALAFHEVTSAPPFFDRK